MGKTVLELSQLAQRKAEELRDIFEKHKTDKLDERGQPVFDMDATTLGTVKDRNSELNDINKELETARAQEIYVNNAKSLADLAQIDRKVAHDGGAQNSDSRNRASVQRPYEGMKLGDIVVNHNEYKLRSGRKVSINLPDIDVKTLMQETGPGYAPPNNRTNIVIMSAQRRPMVADLIPQDPTTNSVIKYMEETTFTNSAATVLEGGLKPESALAYTERTALVEKIATWLPITEEQMDDVPQLQGLINNRLTLMLGLEEEIELLNGNGTAPDIDGFLHKSGVQVQAKGSDDPQDAIYKAFTLVRWTGFAEPSGVIMHPNDWQDIRLLRTTDGLYIFGSPSDPGEERVWGKPVVVTTAMTENTSLTGDFTMFSHISRRAGIRIDISDSHDVFFIYNKLAIRAEERLSLEIYRAAAFCKLTGM